MFTDIIDIYTLVERITASSMILWGAALLVNKEIIPSFFITFTKNHSTTAALPYVIAGIFLTFGLIIVLIHNDWYWGFSTIVTIIGWGLLIKAWVWIAFPKYLITLSQKMFPLVSQTWFRLAYGLLIILMGSLILVADMFATI